MKLNRLIPIFFLLVLFTVAAGCINESTGSFNPVGENISVFESGGIQNVPVPENMSQYIQVNASTVPPYPANQLVRESDLAFYGIFKEFSSYRFEPDFICSDLVFIINSPIKGTMEEEVAIQVDGGEVDNVVLYCAGGSPSPWDFEPGKQYMIYAGEFDGVYRILPGGAFIIN